MSRGGAASAKTNPVDVLYFRRDSISQCFNAGDAQLPGGCEVGGHGGGGGGEIDATAGGGPPTTGPQGPTWATLSTIGEPSSRSPDVRIVPGTGNDAEALFRNLAAEAGAAIDLHPNPQLAVEGGLLAALPEGGFIGFRPFSTSGPPTVDIMGVPGVPYPREIKFELPVPGGGGEGGEDDG